MSVEYEFARHRPSPVVGLGASVPLPHHNHWAKTTMLRLISSCITLAVVTAAPAVVWNEVDSRSTVYTSEELPVANLFPRDSTPLTVVFLVGRGDAGSESLSQLAPQLPTVASKKSSFVHSHVMGVESAHALVQTAGSLGHSALAVGMHELPEKFNTTAEIDMTGSMTKRSKALSEANCLVVKVDAETDPAILDSAVVGALESAEHVVLTSVRSVEEVKKERNLAARRRLENQFQSARPVSGHRRLQEEDEDQQNDNAGIYYVQMTPNILAGLLFFGLFTVIIWTAVSCMGMIAGQDCYVTKYPSIGREA